jgi:hypothetical protein
MGIFIEKSIGRGITSADLETVVIFIGQSVILIVRKMFLVIIPVQTKNRL